MLSLTLAGVKHEQAARTNESIKISQIGHSMGDAHDFSNRHVY